MRMRTRFAPAVATLALLAVATGRADAGLVINPIFDSSITSDPNAAAIQGTINQAIQTYEKTFADPITVSIGFHEMASGLGSSSTFFSTGPYSTYIAALTADATTADDATALAHLPAGANNPVTGSTLINVKTANLRAVGINVNPPVGQPDGFIGLNTQITDIGSPGTSGQFSLLATVEHEIDEVLGLGSALASFTTPFAEDLYRYDASGNRSFTTNSSAQAFFSIDGATLLARFDNQNDGGDFGDWQSNPLPPGVGPKVQDAFATPGAHPTLGVELTALDVIGYDRISAVPEPSTLASAGMAALLGIGAALRSRRAKAA